MTSGRGFVPTYLKLDWDDRPSAKSDPNFGHLVMTPGDLMRLTPPFPIVEGLLDSASIHMLYGPPGTGKSFVALDLCLAIGHGRTWHGRETVKGRFVYVVGENLHGMAPRERAWYLHNQTPTPTDALDPDDPNYEENESVGLFINKPIDLMNPELVENFAQFISDYEPAVLVFDTMARMTVGTDENSSQTAGSLMQSLELLQSAMPSGAIVLVHHPSKAGTGPRGSSAALGAVDYALSLTGSADHLVLSADKSRNRQTAPAIELQLTPVVLPDGSESAVVATLDQSAPAIVDPVATRIPAIMQALVDDLAHLHDLTKEVPQAAIVDVIHSRFPTLEKYEIRRNYMRGLVERGYLIQLPKSSNSARTAYRLDSSVQEVLPARDAPRTFADTYALASNGDVRQPRREDAPADVLARAEATRRHATPSPTERLIDSGELHS